jgi:hypothetical protein
MVRRHISAELKELAVSMSLQGLHASDIQEYTGISVWSIKRFRSLHRRTGNIVAPLPINIEWPRVLTAIHITVCLHYLGPGCCLIVTVPP